MLTCYKVIDFSRLLTYPIETQSFHWQSKSLTSFNHQINETCCNTFKLFSWHVMKQEKVTLSQESTKSLPSHPLAFYKPAHDNKGKRFSRAFTSTSVKKLFNWKSRISNIMMWFKYHLLSSHIRWSRELVCSKRRWREARSDMLSRSNRHIVCRLEECV